AGKEMLWAMKQAGCNALYFGIESAIPWILEYYKKRITPQMAKQAIKNCNETGMDSFASFILGAPGETVAEMWTTLRFASKIGVDIPDFHMLGAAPGMPIWDELVHQGYIDEDKYWRTGVAVPDIVPKAVSREKISELIKRGFRLFLASPRYLTRQLKKTYMNSFRREVIKVNTSLNSLRRFINFY
ncbi:radical SAM protein, partial [Candidatus Borrarchaeum sp.]|uniref:radical SAM protein n=1 Tax=Candidatus Borrarchaeum sp. TaxID=2846742 RepID=UPI00257959A6